MAFVLHHPLAPKTTQQTKAPREITGPASTARTRARALSWKGAARSSAVTVLSGFPPTGGQDCVRRRSSWAIAWQRVGLCGSEMARCTGYGMKSEPELLDEPLSQATGRAAIGR
eukprot:CAMPEP_0204535594 /NCGR_PEP_ID=MMETSP0661-20131031/13824_1 /ASSEMBLY_ACC=CAM_ASM_000606 /TAXON_ID=109239 /ORGANISM="Alexandrium margalefi, Strain AMGDE01CS-322" /LENGTH=113 /DNA_ID=CAMNT_0051542087 /DNA_START=164 /DNA_END=501 /DNA_ORIENTATION=+